jgi:hypothetical protein
MRARVWGPPYPGPLTAGGGSCGGCRTRQAADGRTDLLAEHAGIALGFGEASLEVGRSRQIAELYIAADADQTLIEHWVAVGREGAAIAVVTPYERRPRQRVVLLAYSGIASVLAHPAYREIRMSAG